MTIESKVFLQRHLECLFSSGITLFMESRHRAEFAEGVEWRRGTVYNGGEIQGGFADGI